MGPSSTDFWRKVVQAEEVRRPVGWPVWVSFVQAWLPHRRRTEDAEPKPQGSVVHVVLRSGSSLKNINVIGALQNFACPPALLV
jgi:hypothetical protein